MRSSSTFNQVQRLGNLEKVDPIVFELEYMVDRIQHCKTFIEPALRAGSWVIVDRYALSSIGTLLLQLPSLGRAAISAIASELWFRDLCRYLVRPDVALLLQVDPQTAIARLNNRKEELDRNINASDYAELQRFLVAVAEVNGMILVEASGPLPAVVKTCREFVVKPNAREGRQV